MKVRVQIMGWEMLLLGDLADALYGRSLSRLNYGISLKSICSIYQFESVTMSSIALGLRTDIQMEGQTLLDTSAHDPPPPGIQQKRP